MTSLSDGVDTPAAGLTTSGISSAGDANDDGKVDVSDLGILAQTTDRVPGRPGRWAISNGDGKVDVSDLGILAANYGSAVTYIVENQDFLNFFRILNLQDVTGTSIRLKR